MKKVNGKWVLVTGASSGIGKAFVELLAGQGFNIVLLARDSERLSVVESEIKKRFSIDTYVMSYDLSNRGAAKKIVQELSSKNIEIYGLVNNAGYGDLKTFMNTSLLSSQRQINAMLVSVTELCYFLGQNMKARKEGWIINVASIAAFTPNLPGLIYNGIKSYVVNFTEALNLELQADNVKCLALCPGLTSTNFPKAMDAEALFAKAPAFRWMSAESVAKQGYDSMLKGRSIHVPGKLNRFLTTFYNSIPFALKREMGRLGLIL